MKQPQAGPGATKEQSGKIETWCGAAGQVASHRDVREGLSRRSLEQTVRG